MTRSLVVYLRSAWRKLTSMGTALVLLFLLALAAIPGALWPQRAVNPTTVAGYIADNPRVGPWLDRFQVFDVFSSMWFTSIYILLFVSLIGCLTARLADYGRGVRAVPVPAPRNLSRLPKYRSVVAEGDPWQRAREVRAGLRGWRTVTRPGADGVEIAAERGYLREAGNLIFHFSLIGLLISLAAGKLYAYEGNVIVIADGGPGFCSASAAAFDAFRPGTTVDGTELFPMCVRVNGFEADFLPNGQAVGFAADIDYQAGDDLTSNVWQPYRLQVNDPLRVGGVRLYLLGHGYAPTFTVTFPDGQSRTQTLQWQPEDLQTLLSSGAMRFDPPARSFPDDDERRKNQIAIEGLLAPTEQLDGKLLSSAFPAPNDPAVAVDVYKGDTGMDSGRPQSIFSLDQRMIGQGRLERMERVNLRLGEQVRLKDGTVVRFDAVTDFVSLQLSYDPAQIWVLVFAITMMAGLLVSLIVRRRRVWVKIRHSDTSGLVSIEFGGLARTDNAGWGEEFDRLVTRLVPDAHMAGGTRVRRRTDTVQ
ncbi:cytochrome c biogenesis protein ResB [Mycolicibacterium frederiksbergense]|uniref:cytochrome c biogenesis protein ResB n=1 Tax=Mycolicibacterium frederiksbergense TaxID=117567 RepID=UPI00399AAFEF